MHIIGTIHGTASTGGAYWQVNAGGRSYFIVQADGLASIDHLVPTHLLVASFAGGAKAIPLDDIRAERPALVQAYLDAHKARDTLCEEMNAFAFPKTRTH